MNMFTVIKSVLEEYTGQEILDLEIFESPLHKGVFASKILTESEELYFTLQKPLEGIWTNVNEADFTDWPPSVQGIPLKLKDRVIEQMTSGGEESVFGPNATGEHGGQVGNSDWYASGDTRIPKALSVKRMKKKKKKKKGQSSKTTEINPLIMRRIAPELLNQSVNFNEAIRQFIEA